MNRGKDTFIVGRYVEVFNVTLVVKCIVEVFVMIRPASVPSQYAALADSVQYTTVG